MVCTIAVHVLVIVSTARNFFVVISFKFTTSLLYLKKDKRCMVLMSYTSEIFKIFLFLHLVIPGKTEERDDYIIFAFTV